MEEAFVVLVSTVIEHARHETSKEDKFRGWSQKVILELQRKYLCAHR